MIFEWDEAKNIANIRKHGIDFNDVPEIFSHPILTLLNNLGDHDEDRLIGIGLLLGFVGVVIYTERKDNVIRIISARKATRREVKNYANTIKNQFETP